MGRGLKYFAQYMPEGKVRKMSAPAFFPILSLLPMRCMLYVKDHFPAERYEDVFGELWVGLWERHEDLSKPEGLGKCLRTFFDEKEVAEILEGGTDPKYKKMLVDETAALVEKGAFGAPWFRVTRGDGVEEPFFGSDRSVMFRVGVVVGCC
jgi:2-hydroxychromene-2-carboxylate isomerase